MSKILTHVAVCGDSFAVGHGLDFETQFEKSFGGVVAAHYNLKHVVYGRSGCCNFVIYLQVKKIVEQIKKNKDFWPLVLLTDTWNERITFPIKKSWFASSADLSEVDYLNYSPYQEGKPLAFKTKKNYRLVSEGITTIYQGKRFGLNQLYDKIKPEHRNGIESYFSEIYDSEIKKEIDASLVASAHQLLKINNIPHVFLTRELNTLINKENNLQSRWEKLSAKYPDKSKTGHCNETAHNIVAQDIINHIDNWGFKIS